jgi:hypothetical protein
LTSAKVSCVNSLFTLGEGDEVADFVGVGLFEAVTVALGVGVVLTAIPLFQTSLFPDLTQKYLTPPVDLVDPTLVHLVPAIVAACDGAENADRNTAAIRTLEAALNFIR